LAKYLENNKEIKIFSLSSDLEHIEEWRLQLMNGGNFERMIVPPTFTGSLEDLMHKAGPYNKVLNFYEVNQSIFNERIGHRAIRVFYTPMYELGNYIPTVLSKRKDAFIYINLTNALIFFKVEKVFI
jgi:erythromycin esterase-like protein